ncbi:MMPL family transporter [Actinobacteria bacterium YIM 96077]|uniref:MMPL family transporter n=2 Tax=Phytoactinopolyspora halophila TaxID=1981511 RepID=A0A329QCW6_9ACTN|nr:MMPL family transporter [Actinobacteria bacterium YIM 96077]RAW10255.1 MMPL family transporter [Phytoactinopolyspora halophila]
MDALSLSRFEAPDSEAVDAREMLGDTFGTGSPNVVILISPREGTVDDEPATSVGRELTDELADYPGVGDAWSYWSPNAPETLASEDGRHALVVAWVPGDVNQVREEVLPEIEADLIEPIDVSGVDVQLGGSDEVFRVVGEQAASDFLRAEMIIIPLVTLLLWVVYRRFRLALVTLGVGLFAVAGTLAILRTLTAVVEISTFAANIALVMGIALGVDYGLFVSYRFREELAAGRTVPEAVQRAVAGAGRTVVFSALTVAASLAVLLAIPFPFLASFAYAGVAVVTTATIGAVIVLPAALRLLGQRAVRRGPAPQRQRWFAIATVVMRRPVFTGGAGLVVLVALGAPALGINFGAPDDRVLPPDHPVVGMYDTIRDEFTTEDVDALNIVADDADVQEVEAYATTLSLIDGVLRVDSAAGSYVDGTRVGEPGLGGTERFVEGNATWLAVVPTGERLADDPTGLVDDVRAVGAPFETVVGGYPAELADYRDAVVDRFPLVAVLILLVTAVVLFLMTGSVVAPLKASVLNMLSLSVMFGVLVWGFQEGGLADLLGFTPTGSIEPSIPILMFCVAYGLSMDYEVFLLARIKEDYERTGDVVGSVPRGIARSAPLVTAAALILAASFAVYATSGVSFLQQLGIGMALVVAVDATLIRGVLAPAFMRLAGSANWWAPRPLRRLHDRIGLSETSAGDIADAGLPLDATLERR